jgi:hypothetical protein
MSEKSGYAGDREVQDVPSPIRDALQTLARRITERGRFELSRAASAGRARLELHQLQRDRDHFWQRLGKEAYHLVQAGEIDHPALRRAMERIDDLEARVASAKREQGSEADPSRE